MHHAARKGWGWRWCWGARLRWCWRRRPAPAVVADAQRPADDHRSTRNLHVGIGALRRRHLHLAAGDLHNFGRPGGAVAPMVVVSPVAGSPCPIHDAAVRRRRRGAHRGGRSGKLACGTVCLGRSTRVQQRGGDERGRQRPLARWLDRGHGAHEPQRATLVCVDPVSPSRRARGARDVQDSFSWTDPIGRMREELRNSLTRCKQSIPVVQMFTMLVTHAARHCVGPGVSRVWCGLHLCVVTLSWPWV